MILSIFKSISYLVILLFLSSIQYIYADQFLNENDPLPFNDEMQSKLEQIEPPIDFILSEEHLSDFQKLDIHYDQHKNDYSVLNHAIYEGKRFRLFNYSAYDGDQLKAVLQSQHEGSNGLNSLAISFGYGLEFLVNQRNKIGYEYLSSFPYNRGELIRFFWVSVF